MIMFENVDRRFNDKYALHNCSFSANINETLAIIGRSGAGKTTIARIIGGLDLHTNGKVSILGIEANSENTKNIRSNVGFVFQNFNLFPHMTSVQNAIYAPVHVSKKDKNEAMQKAEYWFDKLKISEHMHKYPHELSGGQKQRIAIIRALMINPKILIMDEPTASLDPELTEDIAKLINELKTQLTDVTIIIVTHDMGVAKHVADRIMFVSDGQVKYFDSSANTFSNNAPEDIRKFLKSTLSTVNLHGSVDPWYHSHSNCVCLKSS